MPSKIEIMMELEKRGKLPQEKATLLTEARRRGLIGGQEQTQAPTATPSPAGPSTIDLATQGLLMGAEGDTEHALAAGQDIYKTVKEPIEYAGLIGGGLAGAALTKTPQGAVATAGLGYAGAKRITKGVGTALGLEKPETAGEIVSSTVGDVAQGATAEAGGQILGAGAQAAFKKLTPFARKLYESALKPAPSIPTSHREKMITIGLENAVQGKPYRPTQKQVYALGRQITNMVEQADNIVVESAKAGDKIQTKPIADSIDDVISAFKEGPTYKSEVAQLEAIKKEFLANKGTEMPTDAALKMKKRIYKLAEKYYQSGKTQVIPAKYEADKSMARAVKEELEVLYPKTAPLNKEASRQIEFGKILERAANRTGNRELFSIFDFFSGNVGATLAGGKGAVTGGMFSYVTSNPQMKSIIAKQIMKAQVPGTVKAELMRQLSRYGAVKATEANTIKEGEVGEDEDPGNVDLSNRPIVRNKDGSISTVRSMSFNINGKEVLLPTVSDDGRVMNPQEAIQQFKRTGKHLGKFSSVEAADTYAEKLHKEQADRYR